jgi:predicted ATPase
MPYITRVQIDECRNVRQLDIDLSVPVSKNGASGPRFRHLILTGPNGSGKSGVLETIALSGWGGVKSSVEWSGPGAEPADACKTGDMLAVYLRARREIRQHEVSGPLKLDWQPATLGPTKDASSYLLQFLVNKRTEQALAAEDHDAVATERIRAWFVRFDEHLRRLTEDPDLTVEFDRRAFNFRFRRGDGYTFDLNALADGHASALQILAELLIRTDVIREARNDFTFMPDGVVIVDEIEAHLHLSLQEQILPFLTDLFPTFQFIVATHSPAVIASIPNAVVYDLEKREQSLSDDFRGIRYGTLMTEHFGISSEIDLDSTEKLLRLRELAARATRTDDEEREFTKLSEILTDRSRSMAIEVWMAREKLGYARPAVGGRR